ncbi:hypothetical protein SLE2022_270810 [Rubroshorea leprosula]
MRVPTTSSRLGSVFSKMAPLHPGESGFRRKWKSEDGSSSTEPREVVLALHLYGSRDSWSDKVGNWGCKQIDLEVGKKRSRRRIDEEDGRDLIWLETDGIRSGREEESEGLRLPKTLTC